MTKDSGQTIHTHTLHAAGLTVPAPDAVGFASYIVGDHGVDRGDGAAKIWALRILAGDACCITAFMQHANVDTSGPAADPLFTQPFIDLDEWRDTPVRHRYVHGAFAGTQTRFSFYFPPPDQYQGRFFHYITPVPDSEMLSQGATGEDDRIGFSITSGAYFVETNGGGRAGSGGYGHFAGQTCRSR